MDTNKTTFYQTLPYSTYNCSSTASMVVHSPDAYRIGSSAARFNGISMETLSLSLKSKLRINSAMVNANWSGFQICLAYSSIPQHGFFLASSQASSYMREELSWMSKYSKGDRLVAKGKSFHGCQNILKVTMRVSDFEVGSAEIYILDCVREALKVKIGGLKNFSARRCPICANCGLL
ncbi:hypothetical protein PTKIN_Ptkin13bG0157900 [Pterospermum kingtungense]